MLATIAVLVLRSYLRRRATDGDDAGGLQLELPFSLSVALKYGALFLLLHVVGRLMQREFGEGGFYLVSMVGGLLSSASAVAAAASLASQGAISPAVAGVGAIIASLTSIAFSLSFVLRTHHRPLIRRLSVAAACLVAASAVGLVFASQLQDLISHRLPLAASTL